MTQKEQSAAAKKFALNWSGKGYEKGECHKFWIDLLCNVYGVRVQDFSNFIFFEEQVKEKIENKTITNFIDAYIPSTKVMIEQKSSGKDLREPIRQSNETFLTPFQQAKKYVSELPLSQHPKWIVTCNFDEFLVYDMEDPNGEPQQIFLKDLEKDFFRLQFLVDTKNANIRREEEISVEAGRLVGKLYAALIKEYIDPDAKSLRSLNILCVRIVFCLYAEDAGLFETRTSFEDYIKSFAVENLRDGLIKLFKALDSEERDKYDAKLKPFPYVNGGLFHDEQIEIPNFTQDIVDVIVNHCAPFDWSEISPTIFGAVFESTLNPETQRKGGMHYTSLANIHKVIDPLFMDGLNAEFEKLCNLKGKQKFSSLLDFQKKLGSLKFLDPACGSGNFLTETYISLRRLENNVISILYNGDKLLGFDECIKVSINQFYGIEINDFAVTVAKTALWIAESQMVAETEKILSQTIKFLPLTTNAFIVEGNALRMDWPTLKPIDDNAMPKDGLFSGFTTESDGTKHEYDYIMGNPPFVGIRHSDKTHRNDLDEVLSVIPKAGSLDYVSAWYVKAAQIISCCPKTRAAFVSTNSITQGEQAYPLWNYILGMGLHIDFAWQTFKWTSESEKEAAVHCVIIGFSASEGIEKRIYLNESQFIKTSNINQYLLDAPTIWILKNKKPVSDVPEMIKGCYPTDGGNYIFEKEEMQDFLKKEPLSEPYFRRWIGSDDMLNNKERYILFTKDIPPAELKKMPLVRERISNVRELRLKSTKEATRLKADTPQLLDEERIPSSTFLVVPVVSSENRRYIPLAYKAPPDICYASCFFIENANLYLFGVLMSNVHNAWNRVICGRLKSDYRYSNTLVYNNFSFPKPTAEQKKKIEKTAQAILDARAKYPESSLADMYGPEMYLFPELLKAHQDNDKAVMAAYGFKQSMAESEIVAELFKMYEKLTK